MKTPLILTAIAAFGLATTASAIPARVVVKPVPARAPLVLRPAPRAQAAELRREIAENRARRAAARDRRVIRTLDATHVDLNVRLRALERAIR